MEANTVFALHSDALMRTDNFGEQSPDWVEVVEVSEITGATSLNDFVVDPFSPVLKGIGPELAVYVLADNGIWYCPDVDATTPTWDYIWDSQSDNYTIIRALEGEKGGVVIHCPLSGDVTKVTYYNRVSDTSNTESVDAFNNEHKGMDTDDWNAGIVRFAANGIWGQDNDYDASPTELLAINPAVPNPVPYNFTISEYLGSASIWYTTQTNPDAYLGQYVTDVGYIAPKVYYEIGRYFIQMNISWSLPIDLYVTKIRLQYSIHFGGYEGTFYKPQFIFSLNGTPLNSAVAGATPPWAIDLFNKDTPTWKDFDPINIEMDKIAIAGEVASSANSANVDPATMFFKVHQMEVYHDGPTELASRINAVRVWHRRYDTRRNNVASTLHGAIGYFANKTTYQTAHPGEEIDSLSIYKIDLADVNSYVNLKFRDSSDKVLVCAGPNAVEAYSNDVRRLIFVGHAWDESGLDVPNRTYHFVSIYRTDDEVYPVVTRVTPSQSFQMATISRCTHKNVYATGVGGVGFSDDFGATWQDKNGDLDPVPAFVKVQPILNLAYDPSDHEGGAGSCSPALHYQEALSNNPIKLRTGDKVLSVTDLSLQTPAGQLDFTRSYVQSKQQNPAFPNILGLGWIHNHYMKLELEGTSPVRVATVILPDGGILKLDEIDDQDNFHARAGSAATLHKSDNNWVLVTPDETQYIFDDALGLLRQRLWATGETWTYDYSNLGLGGNADYLSEIKHEEESNDFYLSFTYDTQSSYTRKPLVSVTDHAGRLVEFTYVDSVGDSSKALLDTVTDVRGKDWQYIYYGQAGGETDSQKYNFLVKRLSPAYDTNDDGEDNAGSEITREHLQYTLDSNGDITNITQGRGAAIGSNPLILTDFVFDQANHQTTETTAGKTTTHHFAEGNLSYLGAENPKGEAPTTLVGLHFRPTIETDPNGNATLLDWSADGKLLNAVEDAVGNTTTFVYDEYARLKKSKDAEERETVYDYATESAQDRQPTLRQVLDGSTIKQWQKFTYDGIGRLTSETLVDPLDEDNILRQVTREYYASGHQNEGLLKKVTQTEIGGSNDISTTYIYDKVGNLIQTNQNSNFGSCNKSRTGYDESGNVVLSICNIEDGTASATSQLDTDHDASKAFDGDGFTYWASENSPSFPQRLVYDFGENMEQVITAVVLRARNTAFEQMPTDFDLAASNDGNSWTSLHSITGEDEWDKDPIRVYAFDNSTAYRYWRIEITDVDGGSDVSIQDIYFLDTAKSHVTIHTYDALGRRTKTITDAGTSNARVNRTFYDALDRIWRTITNYTVQGESYPGDWIWDNNQRRWEDGANNEILHGSDHTENIISDTAYNERGMVRMQRDMLGRVTLYGYDDAGRLVKTVQSASSPDYDNTYGINGDSDLSAYVPNTQPDEDIITTSSYDANGNLVETVDILGNVTHTVYDVLNRAVKRIGDYVPQGSTDPADWEWVIDHWEDGNSGDIDHGVAEDQNIISETTYDAMGRVQETRDVEGRLSHFVYDELGRQVKSIRNYAANTEDPADWEWVNNQWEDGDSTAIDHGTNNDQNIITETIYDVQGRVQETRNVLGALTRFAYDGLGRQVKSITNYIENGEDPADWEWVTDQWEDGAELNPDPIDHGTNNDQNIISETIYDTDGRVAFTRDVLGRITRYVYDELGRQVKVITNFAAQPDEQNPIDPINWVWEDTPGRWEYSSGNAVDHGTDTDQNIISETTYDAQGRVLYTRDVRGNINYQVYDSVGRRIRTIRNYVDNGEDPSLWVWVTDHWEDGDSQAIDHDMDSDQNIISDTVYDFAGRVTNTFDVDHNESQPTYDALGRRTQSIANYVDGTSSEPDEDLISKTEYNKAGQVVATTDVRGTKTTFTYDAAGRRKTVTQAAETKLATTSYTCYDKVGRVQRVIRNWRNNGVSPDAKDGNGDWLFDPDTHGVYEDANLITTYAYDALGRTLSTTDPMGNVTSTTYDLDGRVLSTTDAEGTVAIQRYDKLRRLIRTVQGYLVQGSTDPANWEWVTDHWEDGSSNPLSHGSENDRNIITDTAYDTAGRRISMCDPRGNTTAYEYDGLNRRLEISNFLSNAWQTQYVNENGGSKVTLHDPLENDTERVFDRLGRLKAINYLDEGTPPKPTPDVKFVYDLMGNRTAMHETQGEIVSEELIYNRRTFYGYDATRRLTEVGFDSDGDETPEQTVSYTYDKGGLRTEMTLPGDLTLSYTYNQRGQLIQMNDWDDNESLYRYDRAGRLLDIRRGNDFDTRYRHDAAGRLQNLLHMDKTLILRRWQYAVDGRGNRTQAMEVTPATPGSEITLANDDPRIVYDSGKWTQSGSFMTTSDFHATLWLNFSGDEITFKLGTDADHGICDIYIDNTFWGSRDTYSASAGEETITINTYTDTKHVLRIRNRADKNLQSSGYKLGLKEVTAKFLHEVQTIAYGYDELARLLSADYYAGVGEVGSPTREYAYAYDRSGNRTQESVATGGSPTVTTFTYNEANQLTGDGANTYEYDANGNLTTAGTNTYTWDRANRLLNFGGIEYAYNGLGQRVSQDDGDVTQYLLDVQPELAKVIASTRNSLTTRYVHDPVTRGIHAQQNSDDSWSWMANDALNSVRSIYDNNLSEDYTAQYDPYGVIWDSSGTDVSSYKFTGEMRDANGLQYHWARYLDPSLGTWLSLDPLETENRYAYANANPANYTDSSGHRYEDPSRWSGCPLPITTRLSGCSREPRLSNGGTTFQPTDCDCIYGCFHYGKVGESDEVQQCYDRCMAMPPLEIWEAFPTDLYTHRVPMIRVDWTGGETVFVNTCGTTTWRYINPDINPSEEARYIYTGERFFIASRQAPNTLANTNLSAMFPVVEPNNPYTPPIQYEPSKWQSTRNDAWVYGANTRWSEYGLGIDDPGVCPNGSPLTVMSIALDVLGIAGFDVEKWWGCALSSFSFAQAVADFATGTTSIEEFAWAAAPSAFSCASGLVGGSVLSVADIAVTIIDACGHK